MYSPLIGEFAERDPEGYAGGDENLYRYCGNTPTNAVDCDGRRAYIVPAIWSAQWPWLLNLKLQLYTPHESSLMPWGLLNQVFPLPTKKQVIEAVENISKEITADLKAKPLKKCEPVVIVGHSVGAYIATLVSQRVGHYMVDTMKYNRGVDYLVLLGGRPDYDDLNKYWPKLDKELKDIAAFVAGASDNPWFQTISPFADVHQQIVDQFGKKATYAKLSPNPTLNIMRQHIVTGMIYKGMKEGTIAAMGPLTWPSRPVVMNIVNVTSMDDPFRFLFGDHEANEGRTNVLIESGGNKDPHDWYPYLPEVSNLIIKLAEDTADDKDRPPNP